MDYAVLKAELTAGHPVTGAYSANDATAATEINVVKRTRNVNKLTGDQMFAATDGVQFTGLTEEQRGLWLSFCGRESIDPFGNANVNFVTWIFGAGTATITALVALRKEDVSRAQELSLGIVNEGHITEARRI